jgi:large subunit ribosomal protein L15
MTTMRLNTVGPAEGEKQTRTRVGRGIGCTKGKTCGRGHKGQKSRTGGSIRAGFEGGQVPLQRRVPKFGFTSYNAKFKAEVRLGELNKIKGGNVDLLSLKQAGVIGQSIKAAKIFLSGKIERAFTVKGVAVSKGAREAIETAGGKVED